jgi:hypothetical protein
MYSNCFYEWLTEGSLASARVVLGHLFKFYQPNSVLDVGCGRGTWLKACAELGVKELVGLDGSWNSQGQMVEPTICFKAIDLNSPFTTDRRVDMAMSLEVAEHLKCESASSFIDALTNASDVILFGAAVKGQGGTGHINEQPQSYWGDAFHERHYSVVDILRPTLWSNTNIEFHYRQNAFLYIKNGHPLLRHLLSHGIAPMNDLAFMDCIHPDLYDRYRRGERNFANRAVIMKMAHLLPKPVYVRLRTFGRRFIFK